MTSPGRPPPSLQRDRRTAIVDIGSNSIRLVVYAGSRRAPATLFNEKVSAGLGSDLSKTNAIPKTAFDRGLIALARFRALIDAMEVDETIAFATAAVRDASNGAAFAQATRVLGIAVDVIPGEVEAEVAALGVLSGIPDADGVTADLGGGSLELARVADGRVGGRVSTPLGVLREQFRVRRTIGASLDSHLAGADWAREAKGRPLYLVGGSWRALARLDMYISDHPLEVMHQYAMRCDRLPAIASAFAAMSRDEIRAIPQMSTTRIDTLGRAVTILGVLIDRLEPSNCTISAQGIREGFLYRAMPEEVRARDPLLEAVAHFGRVQSRFGHDGDLLFDWLSEAVLANTDPADRRLAHAACHLADVGWQATPDFRAERAVEIALHGAWVGIDMRGRALLAQALSTSFGGGTEPLAALTGLAPVDALRRAAGWGLAIRLGQRIGGGAGGPLLRVKLARRYGVLVLTFPAVDRPMAGELVERRLRRLAQHLGVEHRVD